MNNQIEGIILAGGKSSRMGQNKALLPFQEKTLIEHIIDSVTPFCSRVYVVTSKVNQYEFNFLANVCIITDCYDNKGPLAGIHAGLKNISTDYGFIMACDMPFFSPHLFVQLHKWIDGQNAILCEGQPFHGFYHKRIVPALETCIHQNNLKLLDTLSRIQAHYVTSERDACFVNLNTPEDYLFYKERNPTDRFP